VLQGTGRVLTSPEVNMVLASVVCTLFMCLPSSLVLFTWSDL